MPDNDLSQETREKLEIARSKVRRTVCYVFTGVLATTLLYGLIWMGDRSAFTATIAIGTSVLSYYFGWRSAQAGPKV